MQIAACHGGQFVTSQDHVTSLAQSGIFVTSTDGRKLLFLASGISGAIALKSDDVVYDRAAAAFVQGLTLHEIEIKLNALNPLYHVTPYSRS